MNVLDQIYERTKRGPQRTAFPEALNEKMVQAVYETGREGYVIPVLVGYGDEIRVTLSEKGYKESVFMIMDTGEETYRKSLVDRYVDLPQAMSKEKALNRWMQNPLYYAIVMRTVDEAGVTFTGANNTIGDVLPAGQMVIDLKPEIGAISGIGLCDIPGFKGSEGSLLAIGDNTVCVNPGAGQLADIATSACGTISSLLDWEPRCAMVSYSTLGSGQGELVDKVARAVAIASGQRPDLTIDGESQFDATASSQATFKKVPREDRIAGKANVIIWLDLSTGNVGVKLIQQFGHVNAYRPMLRGSNKMVRDYSRGTPVSEIKGDIVISAMHVAGNKG